MQAKDIVKLTEELAMPILQENGLEFVDCEFVKEGPEFYLRLYIDKEGGISINECETVSRKIDTLIPEDITDKPYILEVSSPGIDRVLKRDHEYVKYSGRNVEVKLFKAVDGVKQSLDIDEDCKVSLEEVQLVAEDVVDKARGAVTGLIGKVKGN